MVIPKVMPGCECSPYPVLLIGIPSISCCGMGESQLTESQGNDESFGSSVTYYLLTFINHPITCYYGLTNRPVTAKILMLVHCANALIRNS